MQQNSPSAIDPGKTWINAKEFAASLGEIPWVFTTVVRLLLADAQKDPHTLQIPAAASVLRLARSHEIRGILYWATKTFHRERLYEGEITLNSIIRCYSPADIAYLYSTILLYRRLRKMVPHEFWTLRGELILREGELAGHIGRALDPVGLGFGLFSVTTMHLAQMLLAITHPLEVKEYWAELRDRNARWITEFEEELFGCTISQVASMLALKVATGTKTADSLYQTPLSRSLPIKEDNLFLYNARILYVWLNSLQNTGQIPQITHDAAYYPLQAVLSGLTTEAQRINDRGSAYSWLERRKDEIPREVAPTLLAEENVLQKLAAQRTPDAADEAELLQNVLQEVEKLLEEE